MMDTLPNELLNKVLGFTLCNDPCLCVPLKMVCNLWRSVIIQLVSDNRTMKRKTIKHVVDSCDFEEHEFRFCACLANCGHLALLKWAVDHGFAWDEETYWCAAENGHLEILRWIKSQDCPWSEMVCARAALGGQLDTLKWLRSQDCPWNEWTCTFAAANGHLEVLQWARSQNCDWDSYTCMYAVQGGHLAVLQWACDNGCPFDEQECQKIARSHKHYHIVNWFQARLANLLQLLNVEIKKKLYA